MTKARRLGAETEKSLRESREDLSNVLRRLLLSSHPAWKFRENLDNVSSVFDSKWVCVRGLTHMKM